MGPRLGTSAAAALILAALLTAHGAAQGEGEGDGDAAWLRGDDRQALDRWQRALDGGSADAEEQARLRANLNWVKARQSATVSVEARSSDQTSVACAGALVKECRKLSGSIAVLNQQMSSVPLIKNNDKRQINIRAKPDTQSDNPIGAIFEGECFCWMKIKAQEWKRILVLKNGKLIDGYSKLNKL